MTAQPRHLHAVADSKEPTTAELSQVIEDLRFRIGLAKGLLSHRPWAGCEHNAELVAKALDGASLPELQEFDGITPDSSKKQ